MRANEPGRPAGPTLLADVVMALRLFSRLPTGARAHEPPALQRMAPVLPLTSLVIGLGPALVLTGGVFAGLPPYFASALAVGAAVIVTGAMAEDAIADSVDGLFGGQTVERRLEIMKDSRHGTYGVAALCLFIVLRVVGLANLVAVQPWAAAAWLGSMMLARSGALWLAVALGPARRDGVSAAAGRLDGPPFLVGAALALLLGAALIVPFVGPWRFGLGVLLGTLVILSWTRLCRRLVGGQTGDLIGGLMALIEVAVLTGVLIGR